jgi:glycosyltransferase involved in cell wall biosynthesis
LQSIFLEAHIKERLQMIASEQRPTTTSCGDGDCLAGVRRGDGCGKRRLLMLTRYGRLGASSRLRFFIFKAPLQRCGLDIAENQFLSDTYLQRIYGGQSVNRLEIIGRYASRILALLRSSRSDVIWLEKEALPWMPVWIERLLVGPRTLVIDFDDGWHLKYDACNAPWHVRLMARKLAALARRADTVLVANRELLRWARDAGATNIVYIPTTVDLSRYRVLNEPTGAFTIGWIGTPLNLRYLQKIIRPLRRLSEQGARLRLIGAPRDFVLPGIEIDAVPWTEGTEAGQLGSCHVGIMPLDDTPWDRFKSGYKLIQYMAAGRAVVASPVGANLDIVRDGETGFFARTEDDWFGALAKLRDDPELRRRFGSEGRRHCAAHFSLDAAVEQVTEALLPHWTGATPFARRYLWKCGVKQIETRGSRTHGSRRTKAPQQPVPPAAR